MATTLRDFIAQRESEIKEQQRALKAEMRELQVAKAALESSTATSALIASAPPPPTIKEMARYILAGQPNGLNSGGILDGIKKIYDRDIERTSLSPQLSRLKEEGVLVLSGEVWFTKENFVAYKEANTRLIADELMRDGPDPDRDDIRPEDEDCPF